MVRFSLHRDEFGGDLKSLTLFGGLGSKGILWAYDVVQGAQTKRAPLVRGKADPSRRGTALSVRGGQGARAIGGQPRKKGTNLIYRVTASRSQVDGCWVRIQ